MLLTWSHKITYSPQTLLKDHIIFITQKRIYWFNYIFFKHKFNNLFIFTWQNLTDIFREFCAISLFSDFISNETCSMRRPGYSMFSISESIVINSYLPDRLTSDLTIKLIYDWFCKGSICSNISRSSLKIAVIFLTSLKLSWDGSSLKLLRIQMKLTEREYWRES